MDQTIVELNQKIDALTVQMAYLTEETRLQQRRRQEMDELKNDLTPIMTEAFRLSVEQLEDRKSVV